MLKYLIIPLASNSTSFCYYTPNDEKEIISEETLKAAIDWALKENVSVQFVYPKEKLSENITTLIDGIDHIEIVPNCAEDAGLVSNADVVVFDNWNDFADYSFVKNRTYIIRTDIESLSKNFDALCSALKIADRINLIFSDTVKIDDAVLNEYRIFLNRLIPIVVSEYKKHHMVQLNILTDRLFLKEMNNCNAGSEVVTIAPNGEFYICPAFYLDNAPNIGDLIKGLDIKNGQLYKISYAPICRICDAYQCKRCVWLNKLYTHEVNTPGHEQCVVSHIERNASWLLLMELQTYGILDDCKIEKIAYLDPFEKIEK